MGNTVEIKEPIGASAVSLADGNGIARLAKSDTAPLSFAQQQIWLHAQLDPSIPTYNEPVTIHRQGSLDVRALGRALTEIVRRHQA